MPIITDANVLIDYCQSDLSILGLYAAHIEPVLVPSQIFEEVAQLTHADCERLGLEVVEEPLEVLLEATQRRGPLSYPDRVCLYLAKVRQLVCITNEKPLHKACREEGVASQWGLWLMVELVRLGQLDREAAIEVAWSIHRSNPMYIHTGIVEAFIERLSP